MNNRLSYNIEMIFSLRYRNSVKRIIAIIVSVTCSKGSVQLAFISDVWIKLFLYLKLC